MAEGLFREAAQSSPGIQVKSAGLSAINGSIPSQLAIEAVSRYHVDISNQRSRMLTRELIEEADFIFAMTRSHQRSIINMHPGAAEKTFLLREFDEDSDVCCRRSSSTSALRYASTACSSLFCAVARSRWACTTK